MINPGSATTRAAVELSWLPLGAAGVHSVRLNGRIFDAVAARVEQRPACDLYRFALEVRVPDGRFVVEMTPIPDVNGDQRAVVAEGPVGSRRAGRFRIFRYEVRRWSGRVIPDVGAPKFGRTSQNIRFARCGELPSRHASINR